MADNPNTGMPTRDSGVSQSTLPTISRGAIVRQMPGRGVIINTVLPAPTGDRNGNVSQRVPIGARDAAGRAWTPSTGGAGSTPTGGSTTGSSPSAPSYGNDPLGVLADIYSKFFGANPVPDRSAPTPQVVPVGTTGGSSMLPLLLLLGGGGFAVYWFYFRKAA